MNARDIFAFSCLVSLVLSCPSALAIEVTNNADAGPGSLRQALTDAAPGDTITFSSTLDGSTIVLSTGQLLIDKDVSIDASALPTGLTIDADGANTHHRVLKISSGATSVVLRSLRLSNGEASGTYPLYLGGGILNNCQSLALDNCTLSHNSAAFGGGIFIESSGVTTLSNCTLTGNSTQVGNPPNYRCGGGIYNDGQGSITLGNSTLLDNSASCGGGIYNRNRRSTLSLRDCTLSGNSADWPDDKSGSQGGGIFNNGTLTLRSCTLAGNTSTTGHGGGISNSGTLFTLNSCTLAGNSAKVRGGGIYNREGWLTVTNSTLSGNSAAHGGGIFNIENGIFPTSLKLNNSIAAGNTAPSDPNISGAATNTNSLTTGNPVLAPLGNYGGPTQTMLPLPGSPAIDAGGSTSESTDQRGFQRIFGSDPDIGAAESGTLEVLWPLDLDNDGIPFGLEFALGTDPLQPDADSVFRLAFFIPNDSGAVPIRFGKNPAAAPHVSWVLKRSIDLLNFTEVYRLHGPTGTESLTQTTATSTAGFITIEDHHPLHPHAFYKLEAELLP